MRKWLLLSALALTACSSQPDVVSNTYLLPASGQAAIIQADTQQPMLVVRPVEMAEHLAGTGLVYQLSETEIVRAQQNLWAESISEQLTRRINDDLRQKQTTYWPIELTPALATAGLPRLQVKINQFNGHFSGMAHISGEWLVVDGKGDLQGVFPFKFQVPLEQEGYNAQVKALSVGVSQLTSQIARRLATMPVKAPLKL
ncbi:membrane integrity-associated transporter subunit PqiC [Photobacterium sp.]|uniref:PqiC family protein n=1 Tax=Photobacterium sp. TaxID=660 RepID=UPI00299EE1A3|nr:ABC-type transport auxiliary lipoprotein family protein [Photobacterium sp.]MDX1301507.1 ABC-type transport auxiliary lipoprotein family protein [Photobacterium sp.]